MMVSIKHCLEPTDYVPSGSPVRALDERKLMADRFYLHGDYLESSDRNPGSTVYCGFCDGYCLPEHLYNEHEIDQSVVRLNAGKRAFYRNEAKQRARRAAGAANYFEGTADPG